MGTGSQRSNANQSFFSSKVWCAYHGRFGVPSASNLEHHFNMGDIILQRQETGFSNGLERFYGNACTRLGEFASTGRLSVA